MTIASTVMGVAGQQSQGRAAQRRAEGERQAAYYTAAQMEQRASQAEAASQLDAREEIRKAKLMQSRALALAAASGGGVVNPNVLRVLSGIAAEGELAKMTQLYKGTERARLLRMQATATRFEGDQRAEAGASAKKAANIASLSTIMSGAKSMYSAGVFDTPVSKYGFANPADDASAEKWGMY